MTLYPSQDTFVRGEISPRLHARASLDLYRAGLSKCENFLTLPHGGIRKPGGTYFVGEVKNSAKRTRGVPFIFSASQAYWLEFGDLYIRVYAYGARVGSVEVVTTYTEAELPDLMFYQSADVMWIAHPSHGLATLTRTAHTTWTLAAYTIDDGPYDEEDTQGTTLTPASTGHVTPIMSANTTPSGTASDSSSSSDAWKAFDRSKSTSKGFDGTGGNSAPANIAYDFAGSTTKVADAYWITLGTSREGPKNWVFEGYNGSAWITLDTRSGESGWAAGDPHFFEFPNETAYLAYRLNWSAYDESSAATDDVDISELAIHERAQSQTPFNLTASAITGINGGTGFQTTDVGRSIRLMGSDGRWRWARVIARTSTTIVTIQLYDHALPDLAPIARWQLGTFIPGLYPQAVTVFEERLAVSRKFAAYLSKSFTFEDFGVGEEDDDAMEFRNAGGGQANDIVWIVDADGFLVMATANGVRALSGSGIDEALTPSSFKNRRSRTFGCAKISPVDAGSSFLFVTRSRKAIAELVLNQSGRFSSDDIGQISEHIPKKGVHELAFQTDPDPILWFPLDNGEMGGYTHQPAQEVRGMYRRRLGGAFTGSTWGIVESAVVTPGQNGTDDLWLVVKRTIGGVTKRYIEIQTAAFEYGALVDAFQVDCGLTYSGSAVTTFSGLSHLNGQTVDVLASGKVYKGLTVSAGSVSLPGGSAAVTKAHIGLPSVSEAETLELDVGGKDGSLLGRRKKVAMLILSVFETDTTGLRIQSLIRGSWEDAKIPTVSPAASGVANLYTGNIAVRIDDSWEGQGRVRIRHDNPTPCTIRAVTPVFDSEP